VEKGRVGGGKKKKPHTTRVNNFCKEWGGGEIKLFIKKKLQEKKHKSVGLKNSKKGAGFW